MNKIYRAKLRMSSKDEFYGGGVVNGSRSITLMGDLADKVCACEFNKLGRCIEVPHVRLYNPVFAGDYMEYVARVLEKTDEEILIEVRSFKIIEKPEDAPFESSVDVLEDPIISTVVKFKYKKR